VGKSVMLDEVARRAQEQHGWVRIHVQKDDGSTLDERLIVETRNAHALLEQTSDQRTRSMRIEELSVKGGLPFGGLELGATFWRATPATVAANPAIELTERLRALADLAVAMDTAVVITIDEGQDRLAPLVRRSLAMICRSWLRSRDCPRLTTSDCRRISSALSGTRSDR
jgi:hypothetical protein